MTRTLAILEPAKLDVAGEALACLRLPDGRLFATGRAVAGLLGYSDPAAFYRFVGRKAQRDALAYHQERGRSMTSVVTLTTELGAARPTVVYSEHAVVLLLLRAGTKQALELQWRIAAEAIARHRDATGSVIDAAQGVLVDAQGAVEKLQERADRSSRDVLADVLADLEASADTLEVYRTRKFRPGVSLPVGRAAEAFARLGAKPGRKP